ncbi:hypothetical protein [Cellulosilyticum sp. I15G10I2]|uniref:hypothetical protein n=1 Tax=Cellulosilyticum sp. I15G10I2 TaxID=1892843 RepID=UPI001495C049|nr:hypothetical protein [Cellulosilyticum sp. I15G10I2]
MIDFKKELEKFKPLLDVDHIEDRIEQDDMKDLIDILKAINPKKTEYLNHE